MTRWNSDAIERVHEALGQPVALRAVVQDRQGSRTDNPADALAPGGPGD